MNNFMRRIFVFAVVAVTCTVMHNEWRFYQHMNRVTQYYAQQKDYLFMGHMFNVNQIGEVTKEVVKLQIEIAVLADECREVKKL